jgi:hypothetical protein
LLLCPALLTLPASWDVGLAEGKLRSIKGLEIKTASRYHFTPTRMEKLQNLTIPKTGEDVKEQELSFITRENATSTVMLEDSLILSYKARHSFALACNPAIVLLGIYPNEFKTGPRKDTRFFIFLKFLLFSYSYVHTMLGSFLPPTLDSL